jgi:LuxR family maltose regulon positive regulatory protein
MDTEQATATPLLTTKFYVPPSRPEMVSRSRLVELLNAGLHRKLTLISAPAGFGKTTLLSEWVGACQRPVAWLSLDEGDNDPARFMAYLVAALETIESAREMVGPIEKTVLAALQSPQGPQIEPALTALINKIASVPEPFVLVLDDYHLITAQLVHQAIAFILGHLPPQMHLAIAARADPPLPVAGLRGRDQLTEVRQADLRFTPDEAAAFLNRLMGLDLSEENIEALSARTEGWITGLQMAALSMKGRDDIGQFVLAFAGSNVYVLDYLMEEVLERQPDQVQTFLLQTSILERLTGPLCDAVVTGNDGQALAVPHGGEDVSPTGQQTLEMLERSNLFIVRLDDERRWYRYHRLFADLLRQRLEQVHPELPPTLHSRASQWYESKGLIPEAIEHALSAQDFERAAILIEDHADQTISRAEFATFEKWTRTLPDDVLRGRPLLCAYGALVLLLVGGTLYEVKARIADASRGNGAGEFEGELAAVRAVLATMEGEVQQSLELSRRAVELLPAERTFLSGFMERNLGVIYMLSGDIEAARRVFAESAALSERTGDFISVVVGQEKMGTARRMQGHLREAKALYEQALRLATDEEGRVHPVVTKAVLGLADIQREWNDLEAAEELSREGLEMAEQWSRFLAISCYLVLSRVRQGRGDLEAAADLLDRCQRLAVEYDLTEMDDIIVDASLVRVWLAQGDLEAAARWVERRKFDSAAVAAELEGRQSGDSLEYVRQLEYVALGRFYVAQGYLDQALEVLKPLSRATERQGWGLLLMETLALQALAFQEQGDLEQALTVLDRALTLGEPEGYVRTFVDEGEPMADLLREAASRGIAPEYVSRLLGVFEVTEHGALEEIGTAREVQPLAEPLSERELEVLRLLNTSLSSAEMADELVVSVNTVRTHIRSIYSKLGVHSRYEAVDRARELKLI